VGSAALHQDREPTFAGTRVASHDDYANDPGIRKLDGYMLKYFQGCELLEDKDNQSSGVEVLWKFGKRDTELAKKFHKEVQL
jgi:hypothetical protein